MYVLSLALQSAGELDSLQAQGLVPVKILLCRDKATWNLYVYSGEVRTILDINKKLLASGSDLEWYAVEPADIRRLKELGIAEPPGLKTKE